MKKFLYSFGLIVIFGFYVLLSKKGVGEGTVLPPPGYNSAATTQINNADVSTNSTAPVPVTKVPITSQKQTQTVAPTPKLQSGQYKNGSYTGGSFNAYYGNVQVKAVVSAGKLTDVQFLDYPSDRSTSREINSQAMPYLTYEAVQAQSANVDIVSGATDTSQAFKQSLASALSQAR